jgi:hypothetical protein
VIASIIPTRCNNSEYDSPLLFRWLVVAINTRYGNGKPSITLYEGLAMWGIVVAQEIYQKTQR